MRTEPGRRGKPRARAAALALTLLAVGCGPRPEGLAPRDNVARDLLGAALDAWKGGDVAALARRSPPLRFEDPDLASGAALSDFTIGERPASAGHTVEFPARLSLRDRKGATRSVEAVYQVATEPAAAVIRNDL